MTEKVFEFRHLEIVHPEPAAAVRFLEEVFGAKEIERERSDYLEKILPGTRCAHVLLGGVILQIIHPSAALRTWHEQLAEQGPGVHNINIRVADIEQIRQAMLDRGCVETHAQTIDPGSIGQSIDGPTQVYVIDAIKETGLRFEMLG